MATHRQVLETWFRRVWTECDEIAIDEMFRPKTTARGLGEQDRLGPDQFKEFHRLFLKLMEEFHVGIDHAMQSGSYLSALCTLHAKQKTTGKDVQMSGNVWIKVEDGQITDAYNHFDFIGLYQQLGLMPEGCFESCLNGEKIG